MLYIDQNDIFEDKQSTEDQRKLQEEELMSAVLEADPSGSDLAKGGVVFAQRSAADSDLQLGSGARIGPLIRTSFLDP